MGAALVAACPPVRLLAGFAFTSDWNLAEELQGRAAQYLRGQAKGLEAHRAQTPDELRSALSWLLGDHDQFTGVVLVVGLGGTKEWLAAWDWFLRRVN